MQNKDPNINDLEQTIMKYKRTVYGIALTQLNSKHEADDVFQEVFLLYFVKKPDFDSENAKRAWLIRTTLYKCRQYNNSKWNTHTDKTSEPDENRLVGFESESDAELYAAVKQLPQKLRETVYLHCFLGLSLNECAQLLGVGVSAVSMRLKKAERILKERSEG